MQDLRDLPFAGRYACLYVDPPWPFDTWSDKGKGRCPDAHYSTMSMAEIAALPLAEIAAPDAWLFLWTTWPKLAQTLPLLDRWGFTYTSGGPWAKRPRNWRGDPTKWQFGTGYFFRSASEPLLLAKRGNPRWIGRSERNLWVAPVREHSRKPDAVREMIERVATGPRLEMFSRETHPGWDSWGLESGRFDG